MKTRNGFVSNSSSSSFCIFGTVAKESWFDEEDLEDYDMCEVVVEKLQGSNLVYTNGISDYYEEVLVGRSPDELEEDMTIGEHKRLIAEKIQKLFELEELPDISFHVDGGYDG